jgi:hypothetical protein
VPDRRDACGFMVSAPLQHSAEDQARNKQHNDNRQQHRHAQHSVAAEPEVMASGLAREEADERIKAHARITRFGHSRSNRLGRIMRLPDQADGRQTCCVTSEL